MKYVCEIELPDNADHYVKADARVRAARDESVWREIRDKKALMKNTNLDGKCGTCIYFHPIERICGSCCYGSCEKGLAIRQRSVKGCKRYTKND